MKHVKRISIFFASFLLYHILFSSFFPVDENNVLQAPDWYTYLGLGLSFVITLLITGKRGYKKRRSKHNTVGTNATPYTAHKIPPVPLHKDSYSPEIDMINAPADVIRSESHNYPPPSTSSEHIRDHLVEQISEPPINTKRGKTQPDPIPEAPPVPNEQPTTEEQEVKSVEPSTSPTISENIPTLCNTDVDINEAPCNDQESDTFDRIRDPKVMAHYIVLDIETTGFSRDNDRIIEIAAIHYVFGEEAKRFHTFINPQMQIPKHITRLTGIRQDDVDVAPLVEDIADDFCEFIKDYPLVGHNIIDFDLPFLEKHMSLDKPHFMIDTLDMARSAFPLLPSHKLSDLNFWFHLNNGDPHRADADAAATNALMWACLYPEKYESLYRRAIRNGPPEAEHTHRSGARHRYDRVHTTEITPSPSRNDKYLPLRGKKIVFTGELSIARNDAMQMAVDAGALLRTSVSSKTDILVVGKQDMSVVGADGMSTKQEKAQEINTSGKGSIKIIGESEFIAMVSPVPDSDTN